MAAKKTFTDEILDKIKNNKFVAVLIAISVIVGAIASFFGSIQNLISSTNDLFSKIKESEPRTEIFSPNIDVKKQNFEKCFSSDFEIAEYESDEITVTRDRLTVNFSISNLNDTFKYIIKKEDGLIKINPQNNHLKLLKNGGPISPLKYFNSPFEKDFELPNVDIKIVNNTEETVSFVKAMFKIYKSKTDPFPILWINGPGYHMNLPLINVGWGKVYDAIMRFNIFPNNESQNANTNYKYRIDLGEFEYSSDKTNLAPIFRELGVDVDANFDLPPIPEDEQGNLKKANEKLTKARGIFKSGAAKVVGEIEYSGENCNGKISKKYLKFKADVYFSGPLPALPMPPTKKYDVKFESDDSSYQRDINFFHVVKPNEADRFQFKISAPKSSRHVFDFVLLDNANKTISFDNICLNYFVTPKDAEYISAKK